MNRITKKNPQSDPKNLSKKKRFFFKIGAFLMVLALIAFTEITLRLTGYGTSYPLFIDTKTSDGNVVMNPKVGEKHFFLTENATSGFQEPFFKIKPADTYRIFVLGASTGIGYPYRNNGSFHRWLQNGLNFTYPDKNIEVINLSLTAVNSYTLLDFARQLPDYDPDAVLIYAGHNEYYGALGVGASNALGDSPGFVNLVLALREYRIFQAMARGIAYVQKTVSPAPKDRKSLMQQMVAQQAIPLNSERFKAGIHQFEYNLERILKKLNAAAIPVFLSTLASNERGLKPFINDTTNQAKNADFHYKLGEKAYKSGDFNAAKNSFIQAKELDQLRFRAPQKMNAIIRAKTRAFSNVHLVDSYNAFENESPHGILGNELLLEHVHPNLRGYALLGYSFYDALQKHGKIAKNAQKPLSWAHFQQKMPITEVDSLAGFYEILMLKEGWPFFQPIDKSQLKTSTRPQMIGGQLAVKKYSWEEAMQQLYAFYLQNNKEPEALRVLQALILNRPQRENLYLEAGKLALQIDSTATADRLFSRLYRLNNSMENAQRIARSFINAGALRKALPYVEKIKKANPLDAQAARYITAINGILKISAQKASEENTAQWLQLAAYYRQLDQPEKGLPLVEKALSKEPGNKEALRLKNVLQNQ